MYLGGPVGVVGILIAVSAVGRLSVLVLGLGVITGQLAGSVMLDLSVPGPDSEVTAISVTAIAVALIAVGAAASGPLRDHRRSPPPWTGGHVPGKRGFHGASSRPRRSGHAGERGGPHSPGGDLRPDKGGSRKGQTEHAVQADALPAGPNDAGSGTDAGHD